MKLNQCVDLTWCGYLMRNANQLLLSPQSRAVVRTFTRIQHNEYTITPKVSSCGEDLVKQCI
jgi:hypothetical protein